jgi:3-dehydroquinate synthase
MSTIRVNLTENSYNVKIQSGLINNVYQYFEPINTNEKWIIFTHADIFKLYGENLEIQLESHGIDVDTIIIPNGESSKSLEDVNKLYSQLINLQCNRQSKIIALGGGVIGDIAGFVASTFMRGIDYIQIPTTLLAMVDSSVGGKTGVNLTQGKNLVGTFYQPKMVLIDPNILQSLPKRDITSGLMEVIKYGAIWDKSLLVYLSNQLKSNLDNDAEFYTKIITQSCKIKAEIVSKDEKEQNQRKILNFGHTFGHALEQYLGYQISHGEAVGYGMMFAIELSLKYLKVKIKDLRLLIDTISLLPLPKFQILDIDKIISFMQTDKKNQNETINFILLNNIGETVNFAIGNSVDLVTILDDWKKNEYTRN